MGLDGTSSDRPERRRRPSATRRWKTPTPPKRSSRSTTTPRTRVEAPRTARRTTTRRVTRRISPSETGAPTRTWKTSPWASPRTSGRTRTRTRPRTRTTTEPTRTTTLSSTSGTATRRWGTWTRRTWTWAPSLANWCVLPVRPRVFSSFPDPKARARNAFARADLASRASSRVSTAPARHRHALEHRARARSARPPSRNSFGTPSLYRAAVHPRASLGVDFRLSFWRGFFPLEPGVRRILRISATQSRFETWVDTTAAQAAAGKDIQHTLDRLQFTREEYREKRVREYKTTPTWTFPSPTSRRRARTPTRPASAPYFEFAHNTRSVRSNFVHFRCVIWWSTSARDAWWREQGTH